MAAKHLPVGSPTFLFTDIEGSTQLLQELGDRYPGVLQTHHRLMRDAIIRAGGVEVGTEGDAFFVAFERASDALACALDAQVVLGSHDWPDERELRVRMGIHKGDALVVAGDYIGLAVHVAARIASAAHGGQVVLSQVACNAAVDGLPPGAALTALGPHRLKDLREPTELFQLSQVGLRDEFPALRTLSVLPNNLPTQLTSFVGREHELAQLVELVGTNRIVTLTGAGGVGKTRLALQAAAELVEGYPDGAWFVDLAPLRDPALVASTTAAAVGIGEVTGRAALDALGDHLRTRKSVIVLDNCEHVVGSAAQVVEDLAKACPELRLIATSREPLGIGGEAVWRVPSLSVPVDDGLDSAALNDFESVRLFVERATLADARFALGPDDAGALAQICRRLDGIPLAIELAAARTGALTCRQIADRLDDRFRLLTGGSRTALRRQQTLEALVDWSHDLLTNDERGLFRRLAVFAGGFTLEAAEDACSGEEVPARDVVMVLTRLVEKSLVGAHKADRVVRYRLLETMREYAHHKLIDSGEGSVVRDRHQAWCLTLVDVPAADASGSDHQAWLDRVEADYDNVRAALEWAIGGSYSEEAFRMAAALGAYWAERGSRTEGREWTKRALALDDARTKARARALLVGGSLRTTQFDYVEALPLIEESVSIFRGLDDRPKLAASLRVLGRIKTSEYVADFARGIEHFEESVRLFSELHDHRGAAQVEVTLANVQLHHGDVAEAMRLLDSAIVTFRRTNETTAITDALRILAELASDCGDRDRARGLLEEAVAHATDAGAVNAAAAKCDLIGALVLDQQTRRAGQMWDEIAATADGLDDSWDRAYLLHHLGVCGRRLDPVAAEATTQRSLAILREAGHGPGIAANLEILGHHAIADRRFDDAVGYLDESLAIELDLRSDVDAGQLYLTLAAIADHRGDGATFERFAGNALIHFTNGSYKSYIASCFDALAYAATARNDHTRAAILLGASDGTRQRTGSVRSVKTDVFYESPILRTDVDLYRDATAMARAAVGQAMFEREYEYGCGLSLDEATTLASQGGQAA